MASLKQLAQKAYNKVLNPWSIHFYSLLLSALLLYLLVCLFVSVNHCFFMGNGLDEQCYNATLQIIQLGFIGAGASYRVELASEETLVRHCTQSDAYFFQHPTLCWKLLVYDPNYAGKDLNLGLKNAWMNYLDQFEVNCSRKSFVYKRGNITLTCSEMREQLEDYSRTFMDPDGIKKKEETILESHISPEDQGKESPNDEASTVAVKSTEGQKSEKSLLEKYKNILHDFSFNV